MDDARTDFGPHGFTSLDDSETTVQNLLVCTEAQKHIHGSTEDIRAALIIAFATHGGDGLMKRANKLADCCKWPLLILRNNGTPAISLQRCRDRLCPVCSKIKGMQTTARIKDAVKQMDSKRFVTLTIMSEGKTCKQASTDATNGFRELRRSKFWKEHVTAGIWTKEPKPGTKEGTWNVHLHMIIDGKYMPQRDLSAAWLQATGDSYIVDIRKIHDDKGAANYISKYIGKPGNFSRWSQTEIVDYAKAFKGERMLGTFGKLHSPAKLDEKTPEAEQLSDRSISAHKLMQLASETIPYAITAVEILSRMGGFYSACVCAQPPLDKVKISEIDLATLGAALSGCMDILKSREILPVCDTATDVSTESNDDTWNQLELMAIDRGKAYL